MFKFLAISSSGDVGGRMNTRYYCMRFVGVEEEIGLLICCSSGNACLRTASCFVATRLLLFG